MVRRLPPDALALDPADEDALLGHVADLLPTVTRIRPDRRVAHLALAGVCVAAGLGGWLAWGRDSGRSVDPNTTHAKPHDAPPRAFKPGEWCELLDRPPREVYWPRKDANARIDHDPTRPALTVVAADTAMLELAELGGGFELEATFAQTPWTGGVGVYCRGRDEPAAGRDKAFADLVYLWRTDGPVTGPASLVYGEIRRFTDPPQRFASHTLPPAGEIPRPAGPVHRLRVVVDDAGVTAVDWDGQPVAAVRQAARATRRTGAGGSVGLWVQNSTTRFSSVRLRPSTPPGDHK